MFELYKRIIAVEKNKINYKIIRNSKLFYLPNNVKYKEENLKKDVILSPYKYIWAETINNFLDIEQNDLPKIGVQITQINQKEFNKLPLMNQDNLLLGLSRKKEEYYYFHFYFIYIFWKNYPFGSRVIKTAINKDGLLLDWTQPKYSGGKQEDLAGICFAVLKFLSFINISNIKIQEQELSKKTKKYFNKQKSNQTHYHILTVTKPSLYKESTNNDHEKINRPLHQVRGHVADYTEGKGLFGKYNVRIFVPDYLRGDIEYGKINKDYRVIQGIDK